MKIPIQYQRVSSISVVSLHVIITSKQELVVSKYLECIYIRIIFKIFKIYKYNFKFIKIINSNINISIYFEVNNNIINILQLKLIYIISICL
jgi:hypothetical protein